VQDRRIAKSLEDTCPLAFTLATFLCLLQFCIHCVALICCLLRVHLHLLHEVRFGLDLSARRLVATPLSSGDGDDQEDDDGGAVSYDIAKYSAANRLKAAGGSADGAVAAASGDGDGDGGEGGDGAIVDAAAAAAEGGGYGGSAVVAAAPAAPKAATSELKVRRWR